VEVKVAVDFSTGLNAGLLRNQQPFNSLLSVLKIRIKQRKLYFHYLTANSSPKDASTSNRLETALAGTELPMKCWYKIGEKYQHRYQQNPLVLVLGSGSCIVSNFPSKEYTSKRRISESRRAD
jgi:hypothetical protein